MKKYELTQVQGKNIVIDISQLFREEVLYVNATKLAKQFGKSSQSLYQFLNSDGFKEYENAVNRINENIDTLTKKNQRGKYAGTYIHSSLIIYFLRWIDVEFAVKCDLYIRNKIQEIHDEKSKAIGRIEANYENQEWLETRDHGKNIRKLLQEKIKKFCQYAEQQRDSPYKSCPYYKHVTDAIYTFVGIKAPKGGKTPRDVYSGDIVEAIESAELEVIKLLDELIEAGKSRKGIKQHIANRLRQNEVGNIV